MTPPLLEAFGAAIEARLAPIDLRVDSPALVGLIGPNGGGKTSLLRALAGVEEADGDVRVGGDHLSPATPARRARMAGYLSAARDIVWPIAVRDVIALSPLTPDPNVVRQLMDDLELEPIADRPISTLSTGERTRVLIARCLAARPRLLLLDEPFANLDPYWVLKVFALIRNATQPGGSAAIVSLHDLALADRFDRLLLVEKGRLRADGPPADVLNGQALENAFRIARQSSGGYAISPPADRRSSP